MDSLVAENQRSLVELACKRGLDGVVVIDPANQSYFSGFRAIIYSRPIILVQTSGESTLIVPGLEEDHARSSARVNQVLAYYEHPEKEKEGLSSVDCLRKSLPPEASGKRLGVEISSLPFGLGETLKDWGFALEDLGEEIAQMRVVKKEQERDYLKIAGNLTVFALRHSLDAVAEGVSELEVDNAGISALLQRFACDYPWAEPYYWVATLSGADRTVLPHVFSSVRRLESGDVGIANWLAGVDNYRVECERTFFLKKSEPEQAEVFDVVVRAHERAIEAVRPGIPAKEVDRVARSLVQEAGLGKYFIHRSGHGIGLSDHESPSVRFDNEQLLEEGMVFTVEPGVYISGLGGFRHSDTVAVVPGGCEVLTPYPRDRVSLTFK